ncbi:MAG: glycosyltransferase family 39 protein, partial [Bacteroidota bacterium]
MAKAQSTAKGESIQKKENNGLVLGKFSFNQEEKVAYGILACLILLVILIRSKFYNIPFERDEGAYSYYGKLLLEGKIPYKDFYEQKFPGIFYFFATIVAIFGDTVKGMHMGFMYVNIITMIFLFMASKRLFSPLAGVITATTFAIVSMCPNLSGYTVQGEHAVAFFVSIGIFLYSYTLSHPGWKTYLAMGLAMGCAFMTKTSGMFLVLWGGFVIISDFTFSGKKKPIKELIIHASIYSLGVFIVIGFTFMLIMLKGSFNEMLFWTYEIPKKYVNKIPWTDGKKYFEYMYNSITSEYKFFWYHALFALAAFLLKNITWRQKFFALTLIFFSGITIVPGYYFYGHYWIQILPGLSILAGMTFFVVNDLLKNRLNLKSKSIPYVYVSLFLAFSLMHLNKMKDYYFNPNYERILRTVYG